MQLEKLTIASYKNLRNFTIEFGKDAQMMVILGQNGTGKSNLLEALVFIFRNLDLGVGPPFQYQLEYRCRGAQVVIWADPGQAEGQQMRITVDNVPITYEDFYQNRRPGYLPKYVFGYYSGLNDNMQALFEKHYERFYEDMVSGVISPLHPLIYAQAAYRQFALLSFFIEPDERSTKFLQEQLGIQDLASMLFVIAEPPWKSQEGDPRFWNASGAVQRALDCLYTVADAPLRRTTKIHVDYRTTIERECLYLELSHHRKLLNFYSFYNTPQKFFHALTCIEMSGMLYEVRINVNVRNADGSIISRSLSEGEQQLLMVLGLLRFTRDEEALFLLDEPDTHLNPAWSIQYLDLIEQLVGPHRSSQLLMSTHNPLAISSLLKSQVRIMRRDIDTNDVRADQPQEDPRGMGVASILTSDLFKLRSTLDQPTQHLVDRRRELALKSNITGETLSQEEREQLAELNQQLKDLDFSIPTYDPLYKDYVLEMTRQQEPEIPRSVTLTDEQRQRQKDRAQRIIRNLKARKGKQD